MNWHDRGDLAIYDYGIGDLTKDDAWHDLDLSSFIGLGKKLVLLRSYINSATAGDKLQFRTKGNVNDYNISRCMTQVANKTCDHNNWIYTDANGVIQYYFDSATWNAINFTLRGWFE